MSVTNRCSSAKRIQVLYSAKTHLANDCGPLCNHFFFSQDFLLIYCCFLVFSSGTLNNSPSANQVKTEEDPYAENKENIELNFNAVQDADKKSAGNVFTLENRDFKFARPKGPVGGRKLSANNLPGRSLSEPSPRVKS